MARDIFDPARFTVCDVKCFQNNPNSFANNEKGRFQKVLSKISQYDPTSKYLEKGKQLLKISNKIYDSKIIPTSFKNGTLGVIDHYGAQPFLALTEKYNIEMAGKTKRQFEVISDNLRQGNLKFKDVEKMARDLSTLTKYAQGIFGSAKTPEEPECLCDDVINPAKYIADLYFPKYSSWFCVEFEFNDSQLKSLPVFAFLCTKVTRPNVTFEIEEVMKYGHRSYVQKRSEYDKLDLTCYDDDNHNSHTGFESMLRTLIPNMNIGAEKTGDQEFSSTQPPALSDLMIYNPKKIGEGEFPSAPPMSTLFGEDAPQSPPTSNRVSAIQSRASSMNELEMYASGGYLKAIHVYQVFKWGAYVSRTSYINPVMASCGWSELDAAGETMCTINASFRFSTVLFETLENSDKIANKLKAISTTGKNEVPFDKNNGSLRGAAFQLGPTSERLAKYKINQTSSPLGFLDKLKLQLKKDIKKIAGAVKDFIMKGLTNLKNKILGRDALSIAKGLTGNLSKDAARLLHGNVLGQAVNSIGNFAEKVEDGVKDGATWLATTLTPTSLINSVKKYANQSDIAQASIPGTDKLTTASGLGTSQNDKNVAADELKFYNAGDGKTTITISDTTKGVL